MVWHEKFRKLSAAATAGELRAEERAKLDAHLSDCLDCRQAMSEYETAARLGVAAFAHDLAPSAPADTDGSWSVERAETAVFRRLEDDRVHASGTNGVGVPRRVGTGQHYTYRPSQTRWRDLWMPFAATVLLAIALGIAAYRTGVKRGADAANTLPVPAKGLASSLEKQATEAGYNRAQLNAKLTEDSKLIDHLKRHLSEQVKLVNSLKTAEEARARSTPGTEQSAQSARETDARHDEELATARAKLQELQHTLDAETARREAVVATAARLEAKVGELTELVRNREYALDQRQAEALEQQELLEHDRDIRELMGARELYMADVHDVSGKGTDKTYGRVFYTKGRSLIFYAFDLDAQPGMRNAKSFQAWGRKGSNKDQARSLGIFYEDNVSKKRWVLKADDPKTLTDIDAVFVTVEPHGGSQHPSGKRLLFAYLRVIPNHP
jgi:anti-sigma-K factor RskA/putative zinc finger protein